jgi:alkylated DNA repair protein alkB homolog 1
MFIACTKRRAAASRPHSPTRMYVDGASTTRRTAFRDAEKGYQLKLVEQFRVSANGKRRGGRFVAEPTDLSDVLDFSVDDERSSRRSLVSTSGTTETYAIDGHPGFYYVKNALSAEEQRTWVRAAVSELCEPPARTNFARELGELPSGLWNAAQEDLMLFDGAWARPGREVKRGDAEERFFARHLLKKLRWATVGAPFEWTSRVYEPNVPRRAISDDLVKLTRRIARAAPEKWTFDAQAGLVNYYQPGDTLNGHMDDAENNLDRPIVSISLGCPAVFLLGHENRDKSPTAMILRSGDAVILGGESRKCYHGVPRVFASDESLEFELPTCLRAEAWNDDAYASYISRARINISIRDID